MTTTGRQRWVSYGIDAMIECACRAGTAAERRHPAADAISNILAGHTDQPLAGGARSVAYWVPGSRESVRTLVASGGASAGGDLVMSAMLQRVAAAARPRSVLESAGAVRVQVPMGTETYVVPRFKTASGAGWIKEGQAAPAESLTVGTGNASPKLCAAQVSISRRLRLQAVDPIEPLLLQELQRSNRALMEAAFFNGAGGHEPVGILQTTPTTAASFAGALPSWSELVGMIDTYLDTDADYSRATWFMHPSMLTGLMTAEKISTSGNLIVSTGPQIGGLPVYTSTAIPSGKVILLDPSRVVLAYWGEPSLIIDPTTNGPTGGVVLIAHNAADMVLADPAQVIVGTAA